MFSSDGEMVPFAKTLYPSGNVEDWLLEVENVMRESLRSILGESLKQYPEVSLGPGIPADHCILCFYPVLE